MSGPDFSLELALQQEGFALIAGVDEVGRGPLAGPVTAAAVILDASAIPQGLNDSKKLTAKRRAVLFEEILQKAQVGIGHASVEEIDQINILQASYRAMLRALTNLPERPDHALVDGKFLPKGLNLPATPLIRGDARAFSISAASIVAKVTRDRIMWDLAQQYPGYGWETNAGYPTKRHKNALRDLGVTPHHRRSFKPVHNILYQEKTTNP